MTSPFNEYIKIRRIRVTIEINILLVWNIIENQCFALFQIQVLCKQWFEIHLIFLPLNISLRNSFNSVFRYIQSSVPFSITLSNILSRY